MGKVDIQKQRGAMQLESTGRCISWIADRAAVMAMAMAMAIE